MEKKANNAVNSNDIYLNIGITSSNLILFPNNLRNPVNINLYA